MECRRTVWECCIEGLLLLHWSEWRVLDMITSAATGCGLWASVYRQQAAGAAVTITIGDKAREDETRGD